VTAQSEPEPMLIKLTADGTLPNRHHSHLKGCTITLAASGDISSERGKIRTERLSCVKPDGQIIEIKVEGNVAGTDGKNGMRGNPVWRENALLQRAFTAGALSGLSEGISQTYTTNSISPLGNTQTTDSSKILQVGAARGTGKALDKLADYNIQRAEQYHPVIQLSAGTLVDVVFLEGFYLDGKKHNENEEFEVETKQSTTQNHPFFEPESSSQTLPLTPEQVARIDEHSKELGLTVKHEG
jgi:conjugal transfer pilus assembly protein TraB